ncbi:hypothetical protein AB0F77_25285 [Streptomyces sp. NPDC026672]|uniref:hypothetical protein n=1 Tax=unclassified Streptomyces TaxID=2593676 RepID=UPI0033D4E1D8
MPVPRSGGSPQSVPARPATAADRPRKGHRPVRTGFHWQPGWSPSPYGVTAPAAYRGDPAEAEARFTGPADPEFEETVGRLGRDGRTPVTCLDVLLDPDLLHRPSALALGLPTGELLASAQPDWRAPQLHGCTLHSGELSLAGAPGSRRITWTPDTLLLVEDVPRTSLDALPADACTVVRTSDDDPADALRRQAFALLGTRYHSDVPPAPDDAVPPEPGGEDSPGPRQVPTDYPGLSGASEVFVDDRRSTVTVRRFGHDGRGTEYTLPLTRERAGLIDRMVEEYEHSVTAYASVGADQDAARALRSTSWTPAALRLLLPVMRVEDAADAARLTARSPQEWSRDGWDLHAPNSVHVLLQNADPQRSWRASEAAALAAAGISADRARELRTAGLRSVETAVAAHARRPTAAARLARELVRSSQTPVPDEIGARLARAREHTAQEIDSWRHDHRKSCGPEGWGVWVSLTRHSFGLRDGSVCVLWDVTNGWWAISDEGEEGQSCCLFTDEAQARDSWRSTLAALQEYERQLLQEDTEVWSIEPSGASGEADAETG